MLPISSKKQKCNENKDISDITHFSAKPNVFVDKFSNDLFTFNDVIDDDNDDEMPNPNDNDSVDGELLLKIIDMVRDSEANSKAADNNEDQMPQLTFHDLDLPQNSSAASNGMIHHRNMQVYPETIKDIEDEFDLSDDKISLFDTLNSLGKEFEWEKKIQDFARASINSTIHDTVEKMNDYINEIANYGLKTLPHKISVQIKQKVSEFVKNKLVPFNESFKESLLQAGEASIDSIEEIRADMPPPSKVIRISREISVQDKMNQVKVRAADASNETIPGQGNYSDKDFEIILNNNVTMSFANDPDYNSDEEAGFMSNNHHEVLVSKLERESQRQIRVQNDFREALNPNVGLQLSLKYADHKNIIDTINRILPESIEIYNDSLIANHDKTLPPPEVLTYKLNGKIYKLVTKFEWKTMEEDDNLPLELRRKRVNKIQKFFLHLPPPMLPMRKRFTNLMEVPKKRLSPQISKSALNLAINGASKKSKSKSPSSRPGNSRSPVINADMPGSSGVNCWSPKRRRPEQDF